MNVLKNEKMTNFYVQTFGNNTSDNCISGINSRSSKNNIISKHNLWHILTSSCNQTILQLSCSLRSGQRSDPGLVLHNLFSHELSVISCTESIHYKVIRASSYNLECLGSDGSSTSEERKALFERCSLEWFLEGKTSRCLWVYRCSRSSWHWVKWIL